MKVKASTDMEPRHHCKRVSKYSMSCKGVRGTSWRLQREGLIRTRKEATEQGTQLGTAGGGASKDTERKWWSKGYSPSGGPQREGHRGRDMSGHRTKAVE